MGTRNRGIFQGQQDYTWHNINMIEWLSSFLSATRVFCVPCHKSKDRSCQIEFHFQFLSGMSFWYIIRRCDFHFDFGMFSPWNCSERMTFYIRNKAQFNLVWMLCLYWTFLRVDLKKSHWDMIAKICWGWCDCGGTGGGKYLDIGNKIHQNIFQILKSDA